VHQCDIEHVYLSLQVVGPMLKDESGSTAAEYAIILAIIGSVIALAAIALGNAVGGAITHTSSCIASKTNC